jgi:hypothetical protein
VAALSIRLTAGQIAAPDAAFPRDAAARDRYQANTMGALDR